MVSVEEIASEVKTGNFRKLARALTLVENELSGSEQFLLSLPNIITPVIGITGPPGAGKSTLVNALINKLSSQGERVAILAVDPTSPFNFGSLLGDRIRMAEQFNKSNVYIRSLATRGSLGGLSSKTIEMSDVLKAAGFDYIIIETVGVGQSEVEIAGLADISVVVLVPESGDEIQNIKSGLMEIADIFVVNKSDREGAAVFANNLRKIVQQKPFKTPIIQTIANTSEGIDSLLCEIKSHQNRESNRRPYLLTEKAWKLVGDHKMRGVDKKQLYKEILELSVLPHFNLYQYVKKVLENTKNS